MMTIFKQRRLPWLGLMIATLLCGVCSLSAQGVEAKQAIGKLKVSLIFGTDGDADVAGKNLKIISGAQLKEIKFAHYRLMGEDTQSILKRYVNWANPIKGSKQILVSFQPSGKPVGGTLKVDLELWQAQKKIMKSGVTLKKGKPLYVQGPAWRGGKLIIAVELLELK